MTPDTIIEIASDAIFTLLMVASPILGVALSVGLVISLVIPYVMQRRRNKRAA